MVNSLFDHQTLQYRAIEPGMVCYDDFVQEYYLTLERQLGRDGRPYWRLLNLLTGVESEQLERMIVEDPDVEWL